MTQQKSERRIEPKIRRKTGSTRRVESSEGGRASPVNKQAEQLRLPFDTAEVCAGRPAQSDGDAESREGQSSSRAAPKSKCKRETESPATLEGVVDRLESAFDNVAKNKGAPGPDGETIEKARSHLGVLLRSLRIALLDGSYRPGDIRRVWIPKGGGGARGLGIPNVIDRVVAEAVRQILEPLYEPSFQVESHGFRPGRSCHTAIAQAKEYLENGDEWVVDIDLEKFFDGVNHQRLMARLALRVHDRRILVLIGQMLKAKVVMPDGVRVSTDEGVPQGGPLSPLLSNIVLDELDQELTQRGHRFVRYADDCNIYVGSERAGQRVMESVTRFIERRLRLKVNKDKSAVARPEERHFLGFSMHRNPLTEEVDIKPSERTKKRLSVRVRELTPRNWGDSVSECIRQINGYSQGWLGFFGICTDQHHLLENTDRHIRRRLRAIQLKQWKRRRTIVNKLIGLGVTRATARKALYGFHRGFWALSHIYAVDRGLTTRHWGERGLKSLSQQWHASRLPRVVPGVQLRLPWG